MIAAIMVFSCVVAALLSAAGYALEKAAGLYRLPRRGAWALALLASWILPLVMMTQVSRMPAEPTASLPSIATAPERRDDAIDSKGTPIAGAHAWPHRPALDDFLAIGWGATSLGLLLIWGVAAWRLNRRAKIWPVTEVDGITVLVSDQFGPAVLGYVTPRIVMPRTVLARSDAARSITLKHEHAHILAHDQRWLFVALFLVFLAPWNIALWWQLRRLRFAIEVDCDARVLKQGIMAAAYGETLLSINERVGPAPLGIVALTERKSQLERRIQIMMTGPGRYRKTLMGLSLAVATSLVLVATGLSAPAVSESTAQLRKPPPGPAGAPPEKFVALIRDRYPAMAEHSDMGTPVLMVLFNDDGSVSRTDKDYFRGPMREFDASKALSSHFGMTPDHVGAQALEFANQSVLVVYTDKGAQHIPFTSALFPDSRLIDRALAERFFPAAFEHGFSSGEGIWVLLDRTGAVLRTGQESFEPAKLIPLLEARYPGIKSNQMTVTPVVDANMQPIKAPSGGELHLYSVWLDVGSPVPGAE